MESMKQLVEERSYAKIKKNYKEADRLRKDIEKLGYSIIDVNGKQILKENAEAKEKRRLEKRKREREQFLKELDKKMAEKYGRKVDQK